MTSCVSPPARGLLFLVTAPSAAGKDSVLRAVREQMTGLAWAVTAVTRAARPGEVEGRDHFFLGHDEFEVRRRAGWFLETARVYGRSYGTPLHQVLDPLAAGGDVVLRLDVQGARALQQRLPGAVVVFVDPVSAEEAERRIRERATESPGEVNVRLDAMHRYELGYAAQADYRVPNPMGGLEVAADHLRSIIVAERLRARPRVVDLNQLQPSTDAPVHP